MRWITPFGMLHLSGVYFILLFAIAYAPIIHNPLLGLILGLITAVIFDIIVSALYGLRFVREGDYIRLHFDGRVPDCHGLFATACISAVIWTYTGSLLLGLIIPVIIVFVGKQLIRGFYEKIES